MLKVAPGSRFFSQRKIIWSTGILFFLLLLFYACGRKAMPVPPGAVQPPQVMDFKAELEEKNVSLTWTLPAEIISGHPEVEGFYIFRQVIDSPGIACPNCPPKFERIAELPMLPFSEIADGGRMWRYRVPIEAGKKYAFKVTVLFSNQQSGPDSEIVEVQP